jgi:hypothetical protein
MGVLTTPAASAVSQQSDTPLFRSRGFAETISAVLYAGLLATVVAHHEPWFDEAQAWLLARDVPLGQLIAHNLRYEGTPGLWHYLLAIPAKAGLPYGTMGWLGWLFAVSGACLFLWKAPFPGWIRLTFPFSFFVLYQYAAVARSYVLLPLLLCALAALYPKRRIHLGRWTLFTALLANVSLHGFLLALALTANTALDTAKNWSGLNRAIRTRYLASLGLLACVALLIVLQVRSPADLTDFGTLNFQPKHLLTVSALKLRDAFTGSAPLSLVIVSVSAWWFYERRTLILYLFGTVALLALAGIAYSNVWHEGTLVLWWLFVMWVSWPENPRNVPTLVAASWVVLLAIQISWASAACWFDLRFPYSGSEELAGYIHSHAIEKQSIFGFTPKATAVLPYFSRNIFANGPSDHSFWFWSRRNRVEETFSQVSRVHPDYVVLPVTWDSDEELMHRRSVLHNLGYQLARRFDGAIAWKSGVLEGDSYELYRAQGQDASLRTAQAPY